MNVTSLGKASVALLAVLALPLGISAFGPGSAPAEMANPLPDIERGRTLYDRHCAVCHGATGRADGQAAYLLHPPARDFASGKFRLVSTQNGVPTPADLIATMRRGMPGSAMPPWEWLAEEDLKSLELYVRHLSVEGQVANLVRWAEEEDDELPEAEARAIVDKRMVPGPLIDVGAPRTPDPVTIHEGRRLYLQTCASCHGEDGTGNAPVNLSGELRNEDGTPNTARDFTIGVLKGGATHEEIVRRIVAGLPGSPMPSTELQPEEVSALATYVLSLVKPGAQERVLQRRRTVPVTRVAGNVPTDPADPAWAQAEGVWVALMPLWWRNDRVEGVVTRALHDGRTIAFHLSWRDPTRDDDLLGPTSFSDAAAIEVSVERDPPLFAMGATDRPVDIALWRAAWERDTALARDVRDRWPNMVDDPFLSAAADLVDESITARAVGNPQALAARPEGAEALMAQGLGTVGPRSGEPSSWTAHGTWTDGYWDVVYSRAMDAATTGEPALSPGLSAFLAFAVWDGEFGDRNGQKSVSVWHRLQLAP
ncbi:MAG: c-type cytochrome [bacterium]|nr:c-type cytochrome [bacterium]